MKKKFRPLQNGADLMGTMFALICETAPNHRIQTFIDSIAVELASGPYEGYAVRLCRDSRQIRIEFHSSKGCCAEDTHQDLAFFTLTLHYSSTGPSDLKRGCLYHESYSISNQDLLRQTSGGSKIMPLIQNFLSLLEFLPGDLTWPNEFEASWDGIMAPHMSHLAETPASNQ